jgi:hypothetical protein
MGRGLGGAKSVAVAIGIDVRGTRVEDGSGKSVAGISRGAKAGAGSVVVKAALRLTNAVGVSFGAGSIVVSIGGRRPQAARTITRQERTTRVR